jgi:hypothetical protein
MTHATTIDVEHENHQIIIQQQVEMSKHHEHG